MQRPDHSRRPRQATKESDLASACQSANPTPHDDKRSFRRYDASPAQRVRFRRFGGKRTLQAAQAVRFRRFGGKRTLQAAQAVRFRRFGGKRTIQARASVRSADCGRAHFTLRGYMAENGSRGLREEHGDD